MRTQVLKTFIDAVEKLTANNEKVTYYALVNLHTGLSNVTIIDCLEYSTALNFLRSYAIPRGKTKVVIYKKFLGWSRLVKYIEGRWAKLKKDD